MKQLPVAKTSNQSGRSAEKLATRVSSLACCWLKNPLLKTGHPPMSGIGRQRVIRQRDLYGWLRCVGAPGNAALNDRIGSVTRP